VLNIDVDVSVVKSIYQSEVIFFSVYGVGLEEMMDFGEVALAVS